jgi:hypothetical protein
VTLIGKPGCHLCDEARTVVTEVLGEVEKMSDPPAVTMEELSILDDEALAAKYVEDIPVVMIDGREHAFWRVDPTRLRQALTGKGRRRAWWRR